MDHPYLLSEAQMRRIEPYFPLSHGIPRVDDQLIVSAIIFVIKNGLLWRDAPRSYCTHKTIYNRFARWARRGIWEHLFRELAARGRSTEMQMIDSTHIKAHRSAAGGKGGPTNRRLAARAAGAIRRSTHSQMLKAVFYPSS